MSRYHAARVLVEEGPFGHDWRPPHGILKKTWGGPSHARKIGCAEEWIFGKLVPNGGARMNAEQMEVHILDSPYLGV
jgi:hypothetical protein